MRSDNDTNAATSDTGSLCGLPADLRAKIAELMIEAAFWSPENFDPADAAHLVDIVEPEQSSSWSPPGLKTETTSWLGVVRYVEPDPVADYVELIAAAVLTVGELVLDGRHDLACWFDLVPDSQRSLLSPPSASVEFRGAGLYLEPAHMPPFRAAARRRMRTRFERLEVEAAKFDVATRERFATTFSFVAAEISKAAIVEPFTRRRENAAKERAEQKRSEQQAAVDKAQAAFDAAEAEAEQARSAADAAISAAHERRVADRQERDAVDRLNELQEKAEAARAALKQAEETAA